MSAQQPNPNPTPAAADCYGFDLIQKFHPGKVRLSVSSLAGVLDCHEQSIRNSVAKCKFPIHSYRDNGKRYFDVRDVAEYLDKMRNAPTRRRRGRPTKEEQLAKAAAAVEGGV